MRVSLYQHERAPIAQAREFSPAELTLQLTTHRESVVKEGVAWSPAELAPCTDPCRNTGTTKVRCAGGELHRHEKNVISHGCVVFDVDHISDTEAAALVERLKGIGVAGAIHSSYSHNPPDDCALRIVLYPNEPIPAEQVVHVRAVLQHVLEIPADPATKDLSRIYYLPTVQPGREKLAIGLEGDPFEVAPLLAVALPQAATAPPLPTPLAMVDLNALRDDLKRVTSPSAKEIISRVLKGEPLAPVGEHDTSLQRLAGICATYLPEGTPFEHVVALCDTSLRLMGWEDGYEDCLRALEEKFARAVERTQAYRAEQLALRAALKAEIAKRVATLTVDPLAVEATEDGKYSEKALQEWGIAKDEWIIQKGDIYYTFVNGDYIPRLRPELPNTIHRDLSRAPLELEVVNGKGIAKELTPSEIIRIYGTVAQKVDADLAVQRSRYDALTGIFTEAVCPLRHLQPEYSPEVDHWMRLLGGEQAGKLIDWVATITELSRQTCGVYFYGPPGSGKTLLIHGLARLWTTGSVSTMDEAISNFNDAVTKCPLIFADEKLPETKSITEDLRILIGSSTRPLKRKYMASASMNGSIRLALAANHPNLIRPTNDMTEMDLRAVSERILYIQVPEAAREYIDSLGGAEVVNDWIFSDKIAKHALWLRDNHRVAPSGGRFLVMGQKSAFTNRLAVNSGVANQVCEVLVKQLTSNKPLPPAVAGLFLAGGGDLYVNVKAIESIWENHCKTNDRYATGRLARALSAISAESTRLTVDGKQNRYSKVRVEQLYAWADENGVADGDELKASLTKPNPILMAALNRKGTTTASA